MVDTPNSKEITIKEKATSSLTKTFQFDKVFGIKSKQLEVYRSVVEPLIGQVLDGKKPFYPDFSAIGPSATRERLLIPDTR